MPTMREQDDVDHVVCCKHGKPCQLSLQQVPKSARGQEVPRSPDVARCGGGRRKRMQQKYQQDSITDLKGSNSSSTNYENIPAGGLPDEATAVGIGSGGSAITSETEITEDESNPATDERPPSVDLFRQRFEDEPQLYEDIHHVGMHRCGHAAKKAAKKPGDGQKEAGKTKSSEKSLDRPVAPSAAGVAVPMSTADVKYAAKVDMTKSRDLVNPKEKLTEFYAGPCTPSEAERQCKAAGMFRLYHRIVVVDEDQLQSVLPLFIVYRNLKGKYCHVRIVRCGKDLIKIDIEGEPKFRTLSQLITFYDIYAKFEDDMNPFPRKGGESVDDVN
uniref:Uncharacterized protein n=1 Tax=Meloidogyne enterolobii TaxID=390850 RepID=A0A6V7UYY6_MELEN|nr:unnamed protein product [Meloidogyne enterolobii]